ncbi:cell division protein SepF [Caldalkalibacillus horti]|uniref:Cell division protein SepF n=1 Tax=Caldalkalibacillus horti TaxID=77523 RepID=A0ABT9VUF4_9BACI|nr:cell division protein SepF [Bacillus horti]MDQ0164623.1 cell division inhibitor SepF [Bacillus horti]
MGMLRKLMDFLGLANESTQTNPQQTGQEQEYDYEEDEWLEEEQPAVYTQKLQKGQATNNLVQLQSVKAASKIVLMEPHSYEETQDMADHLRSRRIIIVNLQRLTHEQAKRTVDFLSGTVYAIGGSIHKLGQNIFLCTSDNVETQGAISEYQDEFQNRMR